MQLCVAGEDQRATSTGMPKGVREVSDHVKDPDKLCPSGPAAAASAPKLSPGALRQPGGSVRFSWWHLYISSKSTTVIKVTYTGEKIVLVYVWGLDISFFFNGNINDVSQNQVLSVKTLLLCVFWGRLGLTHKTSLGTSISVKFILQNSGSIPPFVYVPSTSKTLVPSAFVSQPDPCRERLT